MKNKIIVLLFLAVGLLIETEASVEACYDCPDWPECSATYGCGCMAQYMGDFLCMPIQQRQALGPLQSLDRPGPYNDFENKGKKPCYRWRPCVGTGEALWYFSCVGFGNHYLCIPTLIGLCPICGSSGEWYEVGRVDYDCF